MSWTSSGSGGPKSRRRRQPTRRTDARGTVRVHHGVALGLGELVERGGGGWGRGLRFGRRGGDFVEPVAGALHGGGMGFRHLLLARRL